MSKKNEYTSIKDRPKVLNARRNLKMAMSNHAYVRGNTVKFYEWLESTEGLKVPQGPSIWICGDCHLGNLGPIANAKGGIDIQIRDLDQTVIGNPAHDLIRLGLSLATSARGSDLPGVTTARMIERMMVGYEAAFDKEADQEAALDMPEAVKEAMKTAMKREWKHLAKERIEDTEPTIPLGKRFWPLAKHEKDELTELFEGEKVRRLITSLRSRDDDAPVELVDAAYWMKGCSSLGLLRYAVLLSIGSKKDKKHEYCLVDVKEAAPPAAPSYAKAKMPRDNGERVFQGAWHLAPALGDRMIAAKLGKTSVFLRELMPQDMKFDIEHMTAEEAVRVAGFLAGVVGKAHARQMDAETRAEWQGVLSRNHTKTLDAPSWLWSGVVQLVATHESAYLEHCRKYAMAEG